MESKLIDPWLRQKSHKKVIVLIHGIGAKEPREYWRQFFSVIEQDKTFDEFDVFVWKYSSHRGPSGFMNVLSSATNLTLREAAPNIKLLGDAWNTTYHTQFQGYQDICLVCHSMGGLVVKSWIIDMLIDAKSAKLATLHHIAFYATPHQGAPAATLTGWNKQLRDMQLTSPFIEEIDRRWFERVVTWKERSPEQEKELYNRFIPHIVFAGYNDDTVPQKFASIRGMPLTVIEGDHSQVIQPRSGNETSYIAWRNALNEALNRTIPKLPISSPPNQSIPQKKKKKLSTLKLIMIFSILILLVGLGIISPILNRNPLRTTTPIKGITATLAPQNDNGSATAIDQTQTTVSTNSEHPYPSYLPGHGSLSFFDPLHTIKNWNNPSDTNPGDTCQATGGALHVTEAFQNNTLHCYGTLLFKDFAFEVQMTIIQGDCGGITFRGNLLDSSFYQLDDCKGSPYPRLFHVTENSYAGGEIEPKPDTRPHIVLALNQPVILAVVVKGSTFTLFVNQQLIDSYQDTNYSRGAFALTARDDNATRTEVVYSNATVWTLD